ncbi:MAG TPA: ornithine cyclodeaminase family protein [Burkholderiaceae bacterium]|nr:ornithine cyclodeaminase family protein [Burkholderiaceae bacterium]
MRIVDAATTRRHLGFAALIEALRAMFVDAGCEVPARGVHRIGGAGDEAGGTLLLMPAWRAGARLGVKTVTIFPGNAARGLPGLHSTYLLFDATTGVPLLQLDGNEITSRRTAAAAALAASFLARPEARRLLVLGTGRVASLLPEALRCVRPIGPVQVWNHRAESARALAATWRAAGIDATATDDLEAAVGHADIVSCATLATAPLLRGAWLRDGMHLDLIGSFTPQMREADADCFARSRVFVDTDEALAKAGDVRDAIAAGAFDASRLQGTLAQLCAGTRAGRTSDAERTLFKAVGSALEDLAAAELVADALARESLSSTPSTAPPAAP